MIFNQLSVNGRPAQRARYPEYGSPFKIIRNDDSNQQIRINANEIENWSNLNRVQMVIASSFTSCRLRIDSFAINGNEATVTPMDPERAAYWGWLDGPLDGTPSYYFENHLDFLDAPGEWFLDIDSDTVYYMPLADENMSTANVFAPQLEQLLHVEGAENVTLFGITFEHAAWLDPMSRGMVQRQGSMQVLASYDEDDGWSTTQFNVLPVASLRARDSGAIHTKSDQSGGLYSLNWIYNSTPLSWWDTGPVRHSHGVYLDDNSENTTVSDNVFMNIDDADIKAKGLNHTFQNNGSQSQTVKDESGIRAEYVDIKNFWRGRAIGRDVEPGGSYTGVASDPGILFDDTFDLEDPGSQPASYTYDLDCLPKVCASIDRDQHFVWQGVRRVEDVLDRNV